MERFDYLFLTLPFVAGTALASMCPEMAFAGAHVCCFLLPTAFVLLLKKGQRSLAIPLLFLCGMLVCWTSQLLPIRREIPFAGQMLQSLRGRIGSLPLEGEQSSNLLLALLSGQKDALPRDIRTNFTKSGAAHLLALSGLHLGIVAAFFKTSLFFLGRSPAAKAARNCLVIAASGLYTIICGASPSLVRAFIFVLFHCLGELLPSRRCEPVPVLCYAACFQLAANPSVISSLSFQLSYAACMGIVLLFPLLKAFYPDEKGSIAAAVWTSISMSLSCQAFTAPLVWLRFGTLPKYFLLTNLLTLPLCSLLVNVSIIALLLLPFPGLCGFLCRIVDRLALWLLQCLEIIAGM